MFNEKNIFKKQQKFKTYYHDMYIEEINKIVLSSNDNKRVQTFNKFTTFPRETILIIMLVKIELNILEIGDIFQIIHTEY